MHNPGGSSPHSDDSDCSMNKDSSLITPKSEPSSGHPLKKQLHQVRSVLISKLIFKSEPYIHKYCMAMV